MKRDFEKTIRPKLKLIALTLTVVIAALVIPLQIPATRSAERPHWNIEFIPDEVDSVSVNINNEGWTTWYASQGHVRWYIADKWANLNQIHVYAAANPRGKNAHIRVFWDDTERQNMEFDNDEDHDVSRP
jgi:hypothetical protein